MTRTCVRQADFFSFWTSVLVFFFKFLRCPMSSAERAPRPDAQHFDEVHVVTLPRYKTSAASGDEWRIGTRVQFKLKGDLVYEAFTHYDTAGCLVNLPEELLPIVRDKSSLITRDDRCDQESCCAPSTVTYQLTKTYPEESGRDGVTPTTPLIRKFCARHSTRGDCGREDADDNYSVLHGSRVPPPKGDVSKSVFGGVIFMK